MTKVIIVVRDGMVESVFSRNKNVVAEVVDLDTEDEDELNEAEKRLAAVEDSKSYRDILSL